MKVAKSLKVCSIIIQQMLYTLATSLRRAAIAAIYLSAKTTESGYSRKISMTNLREAAIAATAYNPCI